MTASKKHPVSQPQANLPQATPLAKKVAKTDYLCNFLKIPISKQNLTPSYVKIQIVIVRQIYLHSKKKIAHPKKICTSILPQKKIGYEL